MKFTLKALLILFIGVLSFTSCENEETIIEDLQQNPTEESESIVTALNKMSDNFDDSGNVDSSSSPAGNIIFDFCFDFVYPITLSYNTGATVSINDLNELVTVLTNSTDQLFINGISFPFDVETFDDTTNSIVIVTINNEIEFSDLLVSCDFQDAPGCNCTDVYDPVCVEITDPNGNLVTITYPNDCYAQCDGFTDADIIDDCDGNDYFDFGFGCFTLNYPIDLILDDGSTITINDDDEFGNAMYNQYVVNFVYPLSVTLEEDGSVVTVNNETEFETVFNNCFGDPGVDPNCPQCENVPFDPVCVEGTDPNGNVFVEVYPNLCYAECYGYTAADVVDCDDSGSSDCTEQDVLNALVACETWSAEVSGITFYYDFDINTNLINVIDDQGNIITTGDFEIIEEVPTGNVFILIDTASTNFADAWYFFDCDSPDGFEVVSSSSTINDVEPDCD